MKNTPPAFWSPESEREDRANPWAMTRVYKIARDRRGLALVAEDRVRRASQQERLSLGDAREDRVLMPLLGRLWIATPGGSLRHVAPGEAILLPVGQDAPVGLGANVAGSWFVLVRLSGAERALSGREPGVVRLPPGAVSWVRGMVRYLRKASFPREGDPVLGFNPWGGFADFVRGASALPRLPMPAAGELPRDAAAVEFERLLRSQSALHWKYFAQKLGVTPAQLRRRFVREFGATPDAYREALRMEEAHKRLRSKKAPPWKEVAAQVGLKDLARFAHKYRLRFGRVL